MQKSEKLFWHILDIIFIFQYKRHSGSLNVAVVTAQRHFHLEGSIDYTNYQKLYQVNY